MLADRIGAHDGEPVVVTTRRGELKAPARVVDDDPARHRLRAVPLGRGRQPAHHRRPGPGVSRMPEFKVCACAVRLRARRRRRASLSSAPAWRPPGWRPTSSPRPVGRSTVTCSATSRTRRTTGSCSRRCSRAPTTDGRLALAGCVTRSTCGSGPAWSRSTAPTARSSWPTGAGSPTTCWSWPPAAIPRCRRSRGLVRLDGRLHGCVHAFRLARGLPAARRGRAGRPAPLSWWAAGCSACRSARALAVRGLAVEVVEGGEHLLGQVDPQGRRDPGPRPAPARHRASTRAPRATRLHRRTGCVLDNGVPPPPPTWSC